MPKIITAKALLAKHVTRKDRVLLLNPPVEETRYSWLRWNQPLDLLKVGSLLRSQTECAVDLIDCMKPDADGKVDEDWLPRDRRYYVVKHQRYPMRRFGKPYGYLSNELTGRARKKGKPTQVWITSLCSYWHHNVAEVCRLVRQALPEAQIVLVGHYARLMAQHAVQGCAADLIVAQSIDCRDWPSAIDLYGDNAPPFLALQLNPTVAVREVAAAVKRGVMHFTFFEDDVCQDDGQPLHEIVSKTKGLHRHLRFHFICGLHPSRLNRVVAGVIADKQVAEAHFEEADVGQSLDLEAYRRTRAYLAEAGMVEAENRIGGFVWIGRPEEQLEQVVLRSFQVLKQLGSLILKPFGPTPGSSEHQQYADYLTQLPHRDWSPHLFPFAELNGIGREEYHDLYRMAAFLNEKVRDSAFDFLEGTLGAQMLSESLRKEVWNLGPSPLRVVD
jgi:hypothetical protein